MQSNGQSATAYDKLTMLTDTYNEGQARLQELRVLTRAIKVLVGTYGDGAEEHAGMRDALALMAEAAGVERNRLYQVAHRLGNEMDTLNHLIQNGTFNESERQ